MWNCGSFFGTSHGGGFHFFGGFLHIALVIALLSFLFWGIKRFMAPPTPAGPSGREALNILDQRLARGELTKEEYQSLKETLS